MTSVDIYVRRTLASGLLLVILIGLSPIHSQAAVIPITDDLKTGNHVWSRTDMHYQVQKSIAIWENASLTIMPGVTVEFVKGVELMVSGRLTANGTTTRSVTLTGVEKTRGSWLGIRIMGDVDYINRGCSFRHCIIEYGGTDLTGKDYVGGNLFLTSAEVDIGESIIQQSGTSGIFGGYLASARIWNTDFRNNRGYAVYLGPTNTFDAESKDPEMENLKASGNGHNAVGLGEAFPRHSDYVLENPGLPYHLFGDFWMKAGGTLHIQPDVTVEFDDSGGLWMEGSKLMTYGTKDHPIVLTGIRKEKGSWDGVKIEGTWEIDLGSTIPAITWHPNEGSQLTYTTIEYGGKMEANLKLDHAKVSLSHCVIRNSGKYGISQSFAGGSVVEFGQMCDNTDAGVYKMRSDEGIILAANNWWGDASGPYHPTRNVAGTGDAIKNDAATFMPFLVAPNQEPGSAAPASILSLTASPERWFIPADGATLTKVILTLLDGSGNPVAGRKTFLTTTRGNVIDGDLTDIRGQAKAYIKSSQTGVATLTPTVQNAEVYSLRSAPIDVTFTTPPAGPDVFPDAEAPYVNRHMELSPLPITVGVPVTMTVNATNRYSQSVRMQATFGKHNYGIGLPLEVISTVSTVIPARSTKAVSAKWTPLVPGHQCIGVFGTFTTLSGQPLETVCYKLAGKKFELPWLHNTNPRPAPLIGGNAKYQMQNVQGALDMMNAAASDMQLLLSRGSSLIDLGGMLNGFMLNQLLSQLMATWEEAINALSMDPPRQDYRTLLSRMDGYYFPPLQPGAGVSLAKAKATNNMLEAHLDLLAKLRAAQICSDRYAGAVANINSGNPTTAADAQTWAAKQAAAMLYYIGQTGQAMLLSAQRVDEYLSVLRAEGIIDIGVSKANFIAHQQQLRTQGFDNNAKQAAQILYLTDAQLEAIRQRILACDPEELSRKSVMAEYEKLARDLRSLAPLLINMDNFGAQQPGSQPSKASATNHLVRVFQHTQQIPVGNPLDTASSITLRVRKINMPSDWMVTVTPQTLSLGPKKSQMVSVSVGAGTATPQGTKPTVAIEGYAGDILIGGVTVETWVPTKTDPFGPRPTHIRSERWTSYR